MHSLGAEPQQLSHQVQTDRSQGDFELGRVAQELNVTRQISCHYSDRVHTRTTHTW